MEERTAPKRALSESARSQRFRAGAVVLIALAVALMLWLALRDTGSSSAPASVTAASTDEIATLAASVGHPIYWAGPKDGHTYELARQSDGTIVIRYLPPGVTVGDPKPYLTVATYPYPGALAALKGLRGRKDIATFDVPNGGFAEYLKTYPVSIHLAYPDVDYQVEVYDPTPGVARRLAASGQITAFGTQ